MGIIGNQKTTMFENPIGADAGTLLVTGTGVIVAMSSTVAGEADYFDGLNASGTLIAAHGRDVAGNPLVFPAGFQPEFSVGLFRVSTGALSIHRVWVA